MSEEQIKTATSAELVVNHLKGGGRRIEFHRMNAAGDVLSFVEGVRAMSLAFLAKRSGIPVREIHLGRSRT